MAKRWFTDEELAEMSRPTMDRAIEAIDRGDLDEARALCEAMKHEWRYLHDLMAEGIGGLISFVQDRLGDDGVADAWVFGQGRGWKRDVSAIAARDRRQIVLALAATWRAHSCSGTGPHPGAFTIAEDDAVLHPLLVHERVAADQVDRLPAVPERSARRLRPRSVHVVLVQGPGRHPGVALGAPRPLAR